MNRREILCTPLGEMLDMLDCNAIAHGAKRKGQDKGLDYYLFNVL